MKNILLLGLTSFLGLNLTHAAPILSTSCEVAKRIRVPDGSLGYYMSSDCQTAYLLPPEKGVAQVTGRTKGDLSLCRDAYRAKQAVRNINQRFQEVINGGKEVEKLGELQKEREALEKEYQQIMSTPGVAVEVLYNMSIGENLAAYKRLNTNLGVAFQPVALQNVSVSLTAKDEKDLKDGIQLATGRSIPLKDGAGGAGSFSGSMQLTMFGTCDIARENFGDFPTNLKYRDVAGILTPTVTYEYAIGGTCKYTTRYNLSTLASIIKSQSSSGGLFQTSTASSIAERTDASSWFNLEMSCDDKRVEEKVKFAKATEIKQQLMQQVLDQISIAKLGYNVQPSESGQPGKSGAQVGAEALHQCPHVYCQVGAVVLDVAQAAFGGTSKTDEFIKTQTTWHEDKVAITMPVTFVGMMGFGN
jgi:hypothetical protein